MSTKKIQSALISVFHKDGLAPIISRLNELGVTLYSTGGTEKFIKEQGVDVVPVESVTDYPSIFSMQFWRAWRFNVSIHIRNLLIKPPFIMYYLTFCLPEIRRRLERQGFQVEQKKDLFPKPFDVCQLVIATK